MIRSSRLTSPLSYVVGENRPFLFKAHVGNDLFVRRRQRSLRTYSALLRSDARECAVSDVCCAHAAPCAWACGRACKFAREVLSCSWALLRSHSQALILIGINALTTVVNCTSGADCDDAKFTQRFCIAYAVLTVVGLIIAIVFLTYARFIVPRRHRLRLTNEAVDKAAILPPNPEISDASSTSPLSKPVSHASHAAGAPRTSQKRHSAIPAPPPPSAPNHAHVKQSLVRTQQQHNNAPLVPAAAAEGRRSDMHLHASSAPATTAAAGADGADPSTTGDIP